MTEEARERKRLRDRERYHRMKQDPEWNSRRDERAAKCRKYRAEHREERLSRERAWKKANPDKVAEQRRRYRERVKADPAKLAHEQAVRAEYLDNGGGRDVRAQYAFFRWRKLRSLFETDCAAYAEYRRRNRERWEKKAGAKYSPRPAMRFPDWATMGQGILDKRSVFLATSYTEDARLSNENFAMHLAIGCTI